MYVCMYVLGLGLSSGCERDMFITISATLCMYVSLGRSDRGHHGARLRSEKWRIPEGRKFLRNLLRGFVLGNIRNPGVS
jgi:hypothetical protein